MSDLTMGKSAGSPASRSGPLATTLNRLAHFIQLSAVMFADPVALQNRFGDLALRRFFLLLGIGHNRDVLHLADAVLHLFAGFEGDDVFGRYVNFIPCAWVTRLACLALLNLEDSEVP